MSLLRKWHLRCDVCYTTMDPDMFKRELLATAAALGWRVRRGGVGRVAVCPKCRSEARVEA